MKMEFKKYPVGTIFNKLNLKIKSSIYKYDSVVLNYPTRLEAMVFDPAKLEPNNSHVYTAGQINFTVGLFRKIKVSISKNTADVNISGIGHRKSLVMHAFLLMKDLLKFEDNLSIYYEDKIGIKHCGLGSSSATIAGVCCAINELYGNKIDKKVLMKYIVQNHVEEIENNDEEIFPVQSIGGSAAAGLFGDGMVIIAGNAEVVKTMSISSEYSVIFAVPLDYIPKDSEQLMNDELQNFVNFTNTGISHAKDIAYRFVHKCLPEISNNILTETGNLIYDYRFNMGSIKNCSFSYDGLVKLGDKLKCIKESNLAEVLALSSVGPGFFAITKNVKEVLNIFEKNNMKTFTTKCYNGGYNVEYNENYWELQGTADFFRDKEPDILVEKAITEIRSNGKNAIDIGCGGGRNTLSLSKSGFDVSILDKYEIMLNTTKKILSENNFKIIHEKLQDISSLDLKESTYDILLAIGVLHQNKSKISLVASVKVIYNSLKLGGIFVYNVFTSDYVDASLVDLGNDKYQTNEDAAMLLLTKNFYSETFKAIGFIELSKQYNIKDINTGKRSVLRGVLIK